MKMSKIALALGAMVSVSSGVATAQSVNAPPAQPLEFNMANITFTLYGDIDQYFNFMKSSSGSHIYALQDGAWLRTRLGLKGRKDVGDGYFMKFVLEQGLNSDNGAQADTTRLFDRQLWAGVATPYGELRAGRQNTAVFFRGDYIDFTSRTLGSVINFFGVPSRYDSDLAYISPVVYGFLFEAHYSLAGSNVNATTKQSVYQLALDYSNGPFRVGYAGIAGKPPNNAVVDSRIYYHNVYANYDYGQGKVYLAYVRSNNNGTTGTAPNVLNNGGSPLGNTGALLAGTDTAARNFYDIYQVSADYKVTPKLRLGALYGRIKDTSGNGKNANGGVIGGYYDVWRDTILYSFIDVINNDPNAGFRQAASAGLQTNFTSPADVNGKSIRGLQVGFVYRF